jgi:adenine-specific DNA-methyltransferase
LNGEPDEKGRFPNLKTLRDYIERTGKPIEDFRFDVQVGNCPTERSKAKIYSEEHHLQELENRLNYEESVFAATLRGAEPPVDLLSNGGPKKCHKTAKNQDSLFEP